MRVLCCLATLAVPAASLAAQDTVWATVTAGPYRAGAVRRFLFGTDYRALWTTPVRVPYLDLATTAGGLQPTTAGGGVQTKSLRFRGADGYDYGFRSVDKSLGNVPAELAGTFVERIALDQTRAQHPAAPAIAADLAAAAGLLHTTPILVVLPDDPALGPHRERFRNTLGYFERRATTPPGVPPFAGAMEIISTDELFRRTETGSDDRVDAHAFLKARLFDLLIGDRDRHRGQWTWARVTEAVPRTWIPIPEDRDQAFVRFDGLILSIARLVTGPLLHFEAGDLLEYDETYGPAAGATWSGRELDRRFLTWLERPVWDSVVRDLQARITDSVIAAAVARMPPEYRALGGDALATRLRARRDRLAEGASRFYELLTEDVELHGSDLGDVVVVDGLDGGRAQVRMTTPTPTGAVTAQRVFLSNETRELRIFLHGGADSATVRGSYGGISVRIVRDDGDVVVDSSRGGGVGNYRPAPRDSAPGRLGPRDWGHQWSPLAVFGVVPDLGLVIGGGARYTRYGFRQSPYAYAIDLRAAVATEPHVPAAEFRFVGYRRDSRLRGELLVRATGLAMVRFYGLGNDVAQTESDPFYRVNQRQAEVTPAVVWAPNGRSHVRLGPTMLYQRTLAQAGRIIAATGPKGSGNFGQVGFVAEARVDTRDRGSASLLGAAVSLAIRAFPAAWDVDTAFLSVRGEAIGVLGTSHLPLRPVLALRAGGKIVRGPYPFQEAAFIGDPRTARLGHQNRYGGDAAAWGNAELRLRLGTHDVIVPGEVGVVGLADAGRVFLSGQSSETWHTAFGGGLWLSVVDPGNVLVLQVVRAERRMVTYFRFGFAY